MPPCGFKCAKIADDVLPNTRPISFNPSPRCQRSQTAALSVAVNIRRSRLLAIAHLTSLQVKCCDDQLSPPSKADIGIPSPSPRGRDIIVDVLGEHVERNVAAKHDRIVESAQIVTRAERGLRADPLADDFLMPDFIAARLAGP